MLLIDTLDLLASSMDAIFDAAVRVDANALVVQGRFLQEKFGHPSSEPRARSCGPGPDEAGAGCGRHGGRARPHRRAPRGRRRDRDARPRRGLNPLDRGSAPGAVKFPGIGAGTGDCPPRPSDPAASPTTPATGPVPAVEAPDRPEPAHAGRRAGAAEPDAARAEEERRGAARPSSTR